VRNILVVLLSESLVLVVEGIRIVDSGVRVSRGSVRDGGVVSAVGGGAVSSSGGSSDSSSGGRSVSGSGLESFSLGNFGGVLGVRRDGSESARSREGERDATGWGRKVD